jgi:hypothetical protein
LTKLETLHILADGHVAQWLPTLGELGAGGGSNPRPAPASVRLCQQAFNKKKSLYYCPAIEFIWGKTDAETENIHVEVEQADDILTWWYWELLFNSAGA